MEDHVNGEPQGLDLPTIHIGWDAEGQRAVLAFDATQFKTWDFVIACLDMAKQQAEQSKRLQQLNQMQAAQAAQQQNAQMMRRLRP